MLDPTPHDKLFHDCSRPGGFWPAFFSLPSWSLSQRRQGNFGYPSCHWASLRHDQAIAACSGS